MSDYRQRRLSFGETFKIHKKGFTVSDYSFLGLSEKNYRDYLSNIEYIKMHPINGEYSKWIDDKLTLKYILSGTDLDEYMPEYYFQIDTFGNVLRLMDCELNSSGDALHDLIELLKCKKNLAFKRISGAIGEGFYKASFKENLFYLNDRSYSHNEFCNAIKGLKNYLVLEFLKPHPYFGEYCSNTANSIRYLAGRINGKFHMIKGFIRFGTINSKFIENYNAGGVLCYIDENGEFTYGNIIDKSNMRNLIIHTHPDTGKEIKGIIPLWEDVVKAVNLLDKMFPQCRYFGIDFVVTSDNKVKILEINSLTSLDALQLDESILKTPNGEMFFNEMIKR